MHARSQVKRLTVVQLGGSRDDGVRRYRLARLDEIALKTPPHAAAAPGLDPLPEAPAAADVAAGAKPERA